MMILSAVIGALSSLIGLYVSYYLNIASGAAIVLTATVIFILCYFFAPKRGLIWKAFMRRKISHG
jgi:ABC-type Mn2+/Zn2+ transport system permease subunit